MKIETIERMVNSKKMLAVRNIFFEEGTIDIVKLEDLFKPILVAKAFEFLLWKYPNVAFANTELCSYKLIGHSCYLVKGYLV